MEKSKLILETPRLRLSPFTPDDLEILHQTFSDPFVRKYLWDDEIISKELAREVLETNHQHFTTSRWGLWKVIVAADYSFAGFAGLWMFFEEQQPQLLYGLLPEKTGYGYATEAAQAVICYTFDILKFDYLSASFDTPNADSRNVCERLGMSHIKDVIMNNKMTSFYRIER